MNKIKIVFVGQRAVGKTALLYRLMRNTFSPAVPNQDFGKFTIAVHKTTDQVRITTKATSAEDLWAVEVWDTKDSDSKSWLSLYCRRAQIVIAVHDNTMTSGPKAEQIIQSMQEDWPVDHQVMVLCQNKSDLSTSMVNTTLQTRLQNSVDLTTYVSALSGEGVHGMVITACHLFIKKYKASPPSVEPLLQNIVQLAEPADPSFFSNYFIEPLWRVKSYCWA